MARFGDIAQDPSYDDDDEERDEDDDIPSLLKGISTSSGVSSAGPTNLGSPHAAQGSPRAVPSYPATSSISSSTPASAYSGSSGAMGGPIQRDFDEFRLWTLSDHPMPSTVYDSDPYPQPSVTRRVNFAPTSADSTYYGTTSSQRVTSTATGGSQSPNSPRDEISKVANALTGLTNLLAENVISHPCCVLRRQCQVNRKSLRFHTTPFTIIPLALRLQKRQGISCLFKGVGSVLITRGLLVATESVLSEALSWPRELSAHRLSIEVIFQHLALKGATFILMTPFFCSSAVETVQSGIASEHPGVFDCLKEGAYRAMYWTLSPTNRLLPIWLLAGPTFAYHMSYYLIFSVIRSFALVTYKKSIERQQQQLQQKATVVVVASEENSTFYSEIIASFWGNLAADVVLYPLETIMNRMYLQGTRTIIDNVDSTTTVTPVISAYDGLKDAYVTILKEEGTAGLYKGFGALWLQYLLHFALLKATKFIALEVIPAIKFK